MSRNVCLVGMMGAGKSTLAAVLGDRLGRRVADTDTEIERWTGRSIPQLFEEHGEDGFRTLERRVIQELSQYHDLVIALGGGAVLRDDNVTDLLLTGVLVHLDVAPDVLADRLENDTDRPLLAGDVREQVHTIHAARQTRYLKVADLTVDADRTCETIADGIIAWALEQGDVLTPSEHEQVMT